MEYQVMTVAEWMDNSGATMEPDDVNGDLLSPSDEISVSADGEQYCVGRYDGNQTWMRFDGEMVF